MLHPAELSPAPSPAPGPEANAPALPAEAPASTPVCTYACTNCAAALHGPFCAQCGERQPDHHDWTLGGLLHEAAHAFAHLDGTLWRTLGALVRRPGHLTAEYFAGRKSRYMRPFALFIVLNVVFFVVQPRTGVFSWRHDTYADIDGRLARMEARRAELRLTPEAFEARFDSAIATKKKGMLLVVIPLFALGVAAVEAHRRRAAAQHVVFAIHFAGFLLFFLAAAIAVVFAIAGLAEATRSLGLQAPARALFAVYRFVDTDTAMNLMLTTALGGWIALALRRVYGDATVLALVKAAVLLGVLFFTLVLMPRLHFEMVLRAL